MGAPRTRPRRPGNPALIDAAVPRRGVPRGDRPVRRARAGGAGHLHPGLPGEAGNCAASSPRRSSTRRRPSARADALAALIRRNRRATRAAGLGTLWPCPCSAAPNSSSTARLPSRFCSSVPAGFGRAMRGSEPGGVALRGSGGEDAHGDEAAARHSRSPPRARRRRPRRRSRARSGRLPAPAGIAGDRRGRAGRRAPRRGASLDSINLAATLADGQQVVIPGTAPRRRRRSRGHSDADGPISLGSATPSSSTRSTGSGR